MADFHLLRPLWLLALIPAVWLLRNVWRQEAGSRRCDSSIAGHLLPHLLVGKKEKSLTSAFYLLCGFFLVAILALTGPTWQRESSPLQRDAQAVMAVVDLSPTTQVSDVQPSRMERAKQKLRDLVDIRTGGRMGLVVYSGTAHLVLPPTDDPKFLTTYLDALEPDLIPTEGKRADLALNIALEVLQNEEYPGTILLVTDSISKEQRSVYAELNGHNLLILGIGTEGGAPGPNGAISRLDKEGLKELGGELVVNTVNQRDVRSIARLLEKHGRHQRSESAQTPWEDAGYFLVPLLVFMSLFWFRPGWSALWARGTPERGKKSARSTSLTLLALLLVGCDGPTGLFLTPDQQGRMALQRGEYARAAELFQSPEWQAAALYRHQNFQDAAAVYAALDSPEAAFNEGNCYAHLGQHSKAVAAYEKALERRADFPQALENLERIEKLALGPQGEQAPPGDPNQGADFEVEDEREGGQELPSGSRSKPSSQTNLSDEKSVELLMRRVETSPKEFLRTRFSLETES